MADPNPTIPTPAPTPTATEAQATLNPAPAASTPIEAVPAGETLLGAKPVDPAAAAPAEPVAPVTLADLKLPEGISAEDPAIQEFLKEAGEAKLPKETSQKLLDQHYAAIKKAAEAPLQVFRDLNQKWVDEIKADPEIGGTKLDSVVKPAVARFIDQFGGDELRHALDLTGAGNNPAVVRAFFKAAQAMTESSNAVTGTPNAAPTRPSPAAALYPNLAKQD